MLVCYKQKTYVNTKRIVDRAKIAALSALPMIAPITAHADLRVSNFTSGWKSELGSIAPVVLLFFIFIGICFAGWSVISMIIAKNKNEPLSWQLWGLMGGAASTVIPTIILAFAGSFTDGVGDAEQSFNDLNINY